MDVDKSVLSILMERHQSSQNVCNKSSFSCRSDAVGEGNYGWINRPHPEVEFVQLVCIGSVPFVISVSSNSSICVSRNSAYKINPLKVAFHFRIFLVLIVLDLLLKNL